MGTVRDAVGKGRFELDIEGQVVFATYRRQEGRLLILHVEAPPPLRGNGAAGRLMEGIVALARQAGEEVVPFCCYARAWLRRHPQAAA